MRWPSLPMLLLSGCVGLSPSRRLHTSSIEETSRSRKRICKSLDLTRDPLMASIRPRRRPQSEPTKPDIVSRSRACSISTPACS
jgi:hypothetical protein